MKLSSANRKERDETRRGPSEALSEAVFSGHKYLSKHQNIRSSSRTEFLSWRSPRAFALVVSLGLVALIAVFAIAVSRSMIASTRNAADIEKATEAYYAAEAALEMAVLANKGQEPGFQAEVKCSETNGDVACYNLSGIEADGINYTDLENGGNGSYASWKVQGRTRCLWSTSDPKSSCTDDSEYLIPYPGSGTAGEKCDPLIAYPNEDHACNWGKIAYGETAVIPLYAWVNAANSAEYNADAFGNNDSILDPSEWGLTEIYIKMRTPCDQARAGVSAEVVLNECDDGDRYVLDDFIDDADGGSGPVDTIVLWEITGKDTATGEENYLHADPERDSDGNPYLRNTEIHEWVLNSTTSDDILKTDSKGLDKDGNSVSLSAFLTSVTKPILSLQIITSLKDNGSSSGAIPYLEFSIKVRGDPDIPPADMYQTLIGEGFSGNFKQSVEMKKSRETGVLKFVIQN